MARGAPQDRRAMRATVPLARRAFRPTDFLGFFVPFRGYFVFAFLVIYRGYSAFDALTWSGLALKTAPGPPTAMLLGLDPPHLDLLSKEL
jgi:hypothetical protein